MGIIEYLEMTYNLDYEKFCEAYGFEYHGTQVENFQIRLYIALNCNLDNGCKYGNPEVLKKYGIDI